MGVEHGERRGPISKNEYKVYYVNPLETVGTSFLPKRSCNKNEP